MKQYEFDFSAMNAGDLALLISAAETNNVFVFLGLVHKFTVGGALHLHVSETGNILKQFGVALNVYIAPMFDTSQMSDADSMNVARLLRQALGGKE